MFSLRRKQNEKLIFRTDSGTSSSYSLKSPYEVSETDLYLPPSNYKAHQRRAKYAHLEEDIHGSLIMNTNAQAPPQGQKVYRYTGFPEPFCHGMQLLEVGGRGSMS